jgi:hypothetical protein
MKTLIASLLALSAVAAITVPAHAGFGPQDVRSFDGPAYGPQDIRSFDGPAYGPSDVRSFEGPAFGPADVRSFEGPAHKMRKFETLSDRK